MERVQIRNSSNIEEVGYDGATQVLEIMFSDGRLYRYFDVPQKIAEGLFRPPGGSPGDYYYAKIHRRYEFERI